MISKISSSLSSIVGLKQAPAPGGTSSFGGKKLMTFLLGTLDRHSALTILRGKGDILRQIWIYACSEWWALHLEEYLIPEIQDPRDYDYDNNQAELINRDDPHSIPDLRNHRMFSRKKYFDCPLAVLQTGVRFPPLGSMPQDALAPINVNMMPFDLFEPQQTLPVYLHGYLPMIEHCRSYVKSYIDLLYHKQAKNHKPGYREEPRTRLDHTDIKNRIAYITIDERPLQQAGSSHRRGGVHVECPGALRMKEVADKSKYTSDLSWYHHWGLGSAIDEFLVGGIFVASNVSNSTAVWNCRIHDTFGDIIGPHGSLERMRDVLGPPTKKLDAGELIWLSDRTPHESLPIEDPSVRRQFFRLVVGEIAFWFADHNTPNPTGFQVPKFVPIIQGNKFDLVRNIIPIVWEYGSAEEISVAKEETGFRKALYKRGIGFLADDLLKVGIYNKQTLLKNFTKAKNMVDSLDPHYYSSYTRYFVQVGLEQMRYFNY